MGVRALESALTDGFRRYGELIGRRPRPFLYGSLLLALALTPALLLMKNDSVATMLFTPRDAASRLEVAAFHQFSLMGSLQNRTTDVRWRGLPAAPDDQRVENIPFHIQILYANETGDITSPQAWDAISGVIDYLYNNFTCTSVGPDGVERLFDFGRDMCRQSSGCPHVDTYLDKIGELLRSNRRNPSAKVRLNYPVIYVWQKAFNWGQFLRNVTVVNDTLVSARYLSLFIPYQYDTGNAIESQAADDCMDQMDVYIKTYNGRADGLVFLPNYERKINNGMEETKYCLMPWLVLTISLVTGVAVFTSFDRCSPLFSSLEAVSGVVCIGLSLLANYGFLFICGLHLNFIVTLTPFLVLCVGIDNDFLLTAAIRQTDPNQPIFRRIGQALADAGSNLMITSVNDFLAFGIGALSDTPAVSTFCLYTCIALIFRFLYQMTFFLACIVLLRQSELRMRARVAAVGHKDRWPIRWLVNATEDEKHRRSNEEHWLMRTASRFFRCQYSRLITCGPVRVATVVAFVGYLAASVWLTASQTVDITPQKLFMDGSEEKRIFVLAERFLYSDACVAHIFVNRPPDFRNKSEVTRFFRLVDALETPPDEFPIQSKDSTTLWLRDYLKVTSFMVSDDEQFDPKFYDFMAGFLATDDFGLYAMDLRFQLDNDTGGIRLDRFHFTVFYRSVDNWEKHLRLMLFWRSVTANFSDMEAYVLDETSLNLYLDQRLTLAPATLQTSAIAILVMTLVTSLLMPSCRSVFFICLTFLSVGIGVVGGLKLWGSNLDPITTVGTLLTLGLSVYYTARVCYIYHAVEPSMPPSEKVALTMGKVGYPILCGGVSTILGALPLGLVPSTMVYVILKSLVLVVAIGLFHGLWVAPVLMCVYDTSSVPLRFRRSS